MMKDLLQWGTGWECNVTVLASFIEALDKTKKRQYNLDCDKVVILVHPVQMPWWDAPQ